MKTILSALILFVFSIPVLRAQSVNTDSLVQRLKEAADDTSRVHSLNNLAYHSRSVNLDSSLFFAEAAWKLADSIGFIKGRGSAYYNIGNYFLVKRELKNAEFNYKKAIIDLEKSNQVDLLGKCIGNLGVCYKRQNNYDKAIETYLKADSVCRVTGDKEGQISAFNNLSNTYSATGRYEEAISYGFKAIILSEEIQDSTSWATSYNRVGTIYLYQNKPEKALGFFKKAATIDSLINDEQGLSARWNNLGACYFELLDNDSAYIFFRKALKIKEKIDDPYGQAYSLNNLGVIEKDRGNYRPSLSFHRKALFIRKRLADEHGLVQTYANMGNTFRSLNLPDSCFYYLEQGETLAHKLHTMDFLKEIKLGWAEAYEKFGFPVQALNSYKEYIAIKDSLLNEENTKALAEIESKYNLVKKDRTLAEKEKDNALLQLTLNDEKLKSANKTKWWVVTGMFGSVFLLLFLWTQKKKQEEESRRKIAEQVFELEETKRQLLEQKNEKLLQDKVHLKAQLQTPEYFAQQVIAMTTNEKPVLKLGDIIYVQSHGNGVQIHTTQGNHFEWQSMKNMEEVLPDALFLRVHKSYLVNFLHISGRTARQLRLSDGTEVNIGAAYREQVEAFFK